MIIWPQMTQQTEQWFRARAGRPTASQFSRIFTASGTDSKPDTWENYAVELIAQSIRPDTMDNGWTGNRHTDRGNALEPEARDEFARLTGLHVEEVGFVTRDDGIVGCSPDALAAESEGMPWVAGGEFKAPEAKTHAAYLKHGVLPDQYKQQVHGSMAVTGLRTWYFGSYCPGFRTLLLKVEWDSYTDAISKALDRFLIFYAQRREELMPVLLPDGEEPTE